MFFYRSEKKVFCDEQLCYCFVSSCYIFCVKQICYEIYYLYLSVKVVYWDEFSWFD